MSIYPPPDRTTSIFNPADFLTTGTEVGVSAAYVDTFYLKKAGNQTVVGQETFQGGILTNSIGLASGTQLVVAATNRVDVTTTLADFSGDINAAGNIDANLAITAGSSITAPTMSAVTLTVTGSGSLKDTNFTGNITQDASKTTTLRTTTVNGTVTCSRIIDTGNLSVAGVSTLTGDVTASGNLGVTGNLSVAGVSTLTGDVTASGNLGVTGNVTAGNLTCSGNVNSFCQTTANLNDVTLKGQLLVSTDALSSFNFPVGSAGGSDPYTSSTGWTAQSSSRGFTDWYAYLAFSGAVNAYWGSNTLYTYPGGTYTGTQVTSGLSGEWLQLSHTRPFTVQSGTWGATTPGNVSFSGKTYTVLGSLDASTWTTLATVTGTSLSWTSLNPTYRMYYLRFVFTSMDDTKNTTNQRVYVPDNSTVTGRFAEGDVTVQGNCTLTRLSVTGATALTGNLGVTGTTALTGNLTAGNMTASGTANIATVIQSAPSILSYYLASISATNNTNTTILFDTSKINQGTHGLTYAAATGRFTNLSGTTRAYSVVFSAAFALNVTGQRQVQIAKSSGVLPTNAVFSQYADATQAGSLMVMNVSAIVVIPNNEYISCTVYQNSGASLTTSVCGVTIIAL
jgi:cytoskeletal protein CcmA (bactofilin family)